MYPRQNISYSMTKLEISSFLSIIQHLFASHPKLAINFKQMKNVSYLLYMDGKLDAMRQGIKVMDVLSLSLSFYTKYVVINLS